MGVFMEKSTPTRDELRAVLANPESTEKQVTQAKLVLANRIASGNSAVRLLCEQNHLSPEQAERLIASHKKRMGGMELSAAEQVRKLKQLLAEL